MLNIYSNFKVSINMDFFIQLSSDVRKFRKDNGWSQQQLADMAGLDRTTISALERNKFNDIGIRKVQRVLQVLSHSLAIESVRLPNLDDIQRFNRENDWWDCWWSVEHEPNRKCIRLMLRADYYRIACVINVFTASLCIGFLKAGVMKWGAINKPLSIKRVISGKNSNEVLPASKLLKSFSCS